MTEPAVLYELAGQTALVTLNRPKALNALNIALIDALQDALARAEADARAVLLTGSGKGFCSGADLADDPKAMMSPDRDLGKLLLEKYHPLLERMQGLSIPLVVAVNGPAAGAGMSLALMGDIVLASKDAYFLQAFVNIGLVPDAGSTFMLPRLIGRARANALMMLGEKCPAAQAEAWGMIHKAVDSAALMDEARALADKIAAGPTKALGLIRQLAADSANDTDFSRQLEREAEAQRTAGRSKDCTEGVMAFLQKRPANFTGD